MSIITWSQVLWAPLSYVWKTVQNVFVPLAYSTVFVPLGIKNYLTMDWFLITFHVEETHCPSKKMNAIKTFKPLTCVYFAMFF